MKAFLLVALLAALCVVSGLLATGLRRSWLVMAADIYAARLSRRVGFGTAWVLFLSNRVTVCLCSPSVARDYARGCWEDVRSGDLSSVELHRELVGTFRDAFVDAGLDGRRVDSLVEVIEREAIRRQRDRLSIYVEPERSAEILNLVADALDDVLAPSSKGA